MTQTDKPDSIAGWNHVPDVPIAVSPFFSWPPDPRRMAGWVAARWLSLAENSLLVGLALICWTWLQPSLAEMETLALGWIAQIWLRNTILMLLVAGGLHLYFFHHRKQGDRLKYDPRDLATKGKQFSFGGQVCDNMFWSLTSGVGFWTAYEVLMFHAMANGWAPVLLWSDNPVWFVALFFLTPIWISFHFYWIHRALHWGPLYRLVHALHHRNVNVGPWSGLSMHPVEHIAFFSSVLIHFIVPAHPLHILFHMQHQALTAATSHTGFENLLVKDRKRLALGTFHHQMHHRYFEVNYGNLEMPWDKWFGSFHDGTGAAHEKMKTRRKRLGR
ncbi:desaturase [Sulfitobacter sp. JL08]|uniref:sterol desaturase family protein n=1 Tax=Sulfitobacter sp. JL08 TaxID=2070369 RepID=UPI000E0BA653|nr:sterol desaturase family protein [Sulfitobacter sp. JL08]AXI53755.1 desaturase [Sulfitobacter sp. JL08]